MTDESGYLAIAITSLAIVSISAAVVLTLSADYALNRENSLIGVMTSTIYYLAEATCEAVETMCEKTRSKFRIGKRKRYNSRKKAKEVEKIGKGKEPIHHPNGEHGPHFHPNVEMPTKQTPHIPSPHDHYYYGGIGVNRYEYK